MRISEAEARLEAEGPSLIEGLGKSGIARAFSMALLLRGASNDGTVWSLTVVDGDDPFNLT
jgi:hypothetical protein